MPESTTAAMTPMADRRPVPASAVVVTRPASLAAPLSARLADMGLRTTVFPLLEILPPADPGAVEAAASGLRNYALVVFVSPNAVTAFVPHVGHWPDGVAIAVVGAGSRRRLADFGITDSNATIISPRAGEVQESESLLRHPELQKLQGGRALIVRSESGRELIAAALKSNGVAVDYLAAYRCVPPAMDEARTRALAALLDGRHDWIITSAQALAVLLAQADQIAGAAGAAAIRRQRLIVSHPRIAAAARAAGLTNIELAGIGDDEIVRHVSSLHLPPEASVRQDGFG